MTAIRKFTAGGSQGDGVQIGDTGEKLGFLGATPVVLPAAAAQNAAVDNSTGTAGDTIAAGAGVTTLSIPLDFPSIATGDILVAYVPGYKFKLLGATVAVTKPVTTGAKAATITPKITGVAVTGGVVALTSANSTPVGALVAGSAVTALNTGAATDSITLTASAVTTFIEGQGVLLLKIQNMDTADAIASLAQKNNAHRTALVNLGLEKGSA